MLRKTALALLTAVVSLAALTVYVSAASPRSQAPRETKPFHATKDCSGYTGKIGAYCTIRSSNVKALGPGSRIFYFQQSGKATLDSDIVIYAGAGNVTTGHCLLHLASGLGLCTLSDGTGTLAGFHARVRVSVDHSVPLLWHWDGTYSFGKG
jgi:hypothetical protein